MRKLNDLGLNRRGKASAATIQLNHAGNIRLNLGTRIDNARLKLHFFLKVLLLERTVTLEGDTVDDRVLDDRHDHATAFLAQRDVGKKACAEELFERSVGDRRIIWHARTKQHIRPHGIGFDTLVALYCYLCDDNPCR